MSSMASCDLAMPPPYRVCACSLSGINCHGSTRKSRRGLTRRIICSEKSPFHTPTSAPTLPLGRSRRRKFLQSWRPGRRGEEMASYAEAVRGVWIDACLVPVCPADMQAAFIYSEDFALPARGACTDRDYSSWPELQVNS